MFVYIYIYLYVCMYVCMYVCIYIYIYMCISVLNNYEQFTRLAETGLAQHSLDYIHIA